MIDKNEFLKNLSNDLAPVKKLWSPQLRLLAWSLLSLIVVVMAMLQVQGFRPDFLSQFSSLQFLLESFFAILCFFSLGLIVLLKAIPGIKVSKPMLTLGLSPFVLFTGFILYGYYMNPSLAPTMAGKRPECFVEILTLSWLPIFAMIYLLKKAHPRPSFSLSLFVGIAGASLPMSLMQIACMYDPYHILSHHIYGAAIVAAVTMVGGKILLSDLKKS